MSDKSRTRPKCRTVGQMSDQPGKSDTVRVGRSESDCPTFVRLGHQPYKIVNLYRTSGISTMLYVCSVRYAQCARYEYSFSGQSKRGQSKRRLLRHFRKWKVNRFYFDIFRGILRYHNGGLFEFFPKSIHRCILFEVNSAAIRTGLRPFFTARVQDLGFRKITLWGGKYVNFSRTQKLRTRVLEKWPYFSRTRVLSFWVLGNFKFQEPRTHAVRNGLRFGSIWTLEKLLWMTKS